MVRVSRLRKAQLVPHPLAPRPSSLALNRMTRREFLQLLAAAAAAGLPLDRRGVLAGDLTTSLYDLPPFGNVGLAAHHRLPRAAAARTLPRAEREHRRGRGFRQATSPGRRCDSSGISTSKQARRAAHAFTCLDFDHAAATYGKVGGFAHLATLVKRLRASAPGALLLDGGDTWQGSATALWTRGQDMVGRCTSCSA